MGRRKNLQRQKPANTKHNEMNSVATMIHVKSLKVLIFTFFSLPLAVNRNASVYVILLPFQFPSHFNLCTLYTLFIRIFSSPLSSHNFIFKYITVQYMVIVVAYMYNFLLSDVISWILCIKINIKNITLLGIESQKFCTFTILVEIRCYKRIKLKEKNSIFNLI